MKRYEFSFYLNEDIKQKFNNFCIRNGFLKEELLQHMVMKTVGQKKLVFSPESFPDMELKLSAPEKDLFKISFSVEEPWIIDNFKSICENKGYTMTRIIYSLILMCAIHGKIPFKYMEI